MADEERQKLIADLVQEHRNILEMFRKAFISGILTEQGRTMFQVAKASFMLHNEVEERHVYQPLQDFRSTRHQPGRGSDYLGEAISGYTQTVDILHEFEDKLDSSNNLHHSESSQQLMTLINTISERIEFEESILFRMYDNMHPKPTDSSSD